jgi:hypothetical protein
MIGLFFSHSSTEYDWAGVRLTAEAIVPCDKSEGTKFRLREEFMWISHNHGYCTSHAYIYFIFMDLYYPCDARPSLDGILRPFRNKATVQKYLA